MGNGQARDVKTSRTLVLQTKSSLRLDCRIQAGLYTSWWLSILIGRTMGTCLNRRTMGERTIRSLVRVRTSESRTNES